MMVNLLRTAFWSALLFALVMALLPVPPQLPAEISDKIQHALAFGALAALAACAWPQVGLGRIGLRLSVCGAAIELVQMIPSLNREGDLWDWAVDTAAIATMLAVIALIRASRQAPSPAYEIS